LAAVPRVLWIPSLGPSALVCTSVAGGRLPGSEPIESGPGPLRTDGV